MQNVCIIQEHLPHYRAKFYDLLRANLSELNIRLSLVYSPVTADNLIGTSLSWAIPKRIIKIGKFAWQPAWLLTREAELVIVQQESKYLLNYPLFLENQFLSKKLAFWGHGRNLQAPNANSISEKVKKFISSRIHWWFAYNDLSTSIVRELGYPSERITNVQNAIDTKKIRDAFKKVSTSDRYALKQQLGTQSDNICVYTGGMYPEKRLEFLLEASHKIKSRIPDFELILIGKGMDAEIAEHAAQQYPWIRYLGAKNDEEKVPYWAISKLLLMPGLVGLVVLDSFALETPIVTTNYPYHSPEIDYLQSGMNGLIVQKWEDASIYADGVIQLLLDEEKTKKLIEGCRVAAEKYTAEEMARRFAGGVVKALNSPIYRR